MLERGEVDACLLLGSEGVSWFSPEAVAGAANDPNDRAGLSLGCVGLGSGGAHHDRGYGYHLPGTAYRMDEVPIPLRAVLTSQYPSDAAVLQEITRRVM